MQSKGLATNGVMDLRLVPLDSIDATPELAEHLLEGDHASRRLHAMGFAIVDAGSGCPVVIPSDIIARCSVSPWAACVGPTTVNLVPVFYNFRPNLMRVMLGA